MEIPNRVPSALGISRSVARTLPQISDTLLDVDVGSTDGYYRLCREQNGIRKIVYVYISDIDVLPEDSRTSKDELFRDLSRLEEWDSTWDTLRISLEAGIPVCYINDFKPHGIPIGGLLDDQAYFNILDFTVLSHVKSRVRYVKLGSRHYYMKTARFRHEIRYLQQEVQVYDALRRHEFLFAPDFIGYVYEGTKDRVTSFIIDALEGTRASIEDLRQCEEALHQLHSLNILHGDLVRDNFLVTRSGVKLIDFEVSSLGPEGDAKDWTQRKQVEFSELEAMLSDESNRGRPWEG